MCSSVRGHEVLKGVPLLAGVIYGDEAEAGLMQMDLNTEPCDVRGENLLQKCKKSTWWCVHGAAGSFSSLCTFTQEKAQRKEGLPKLWPLGCWGRDVGSPDSAQSLGVSWAELGLEQLQELRKQCLPWGCFSHCPVWSAGVPGAWGGWESALGHFYTPRLFSNRTNLK